MSDISCVVDGTAVVVENDSIMSALVSLHTSADAFQLTEFNKALHKTTPGGKLARFFGKADKELQSVTLDQMLRHQLEPLPAPLLRSSGAMLHSKSMKTFGFIQRFSEEPYLTMDDAMETAQKLLQMGMRHPEMRDEIYMQLLKQTRGNTDPASRLQLWKLLHVVTATMPPSKEYVNLLSHYIHEVANDEAEETEIQSKAFATFRALSKSVRSKARIWLPSIEEIKATVTDQKIKTVVYFLDEMCEEIEYDIATTVLEAVEQIAAILELKHFHSFSLFEMYETADGEEFVLLDDQRYVPDVLNDLGRTSHKIGRLIFKKRMFRETDNAVMETMFLNLSYIQVQHDYLLGHYPVVYEDAAQLCALQLYSEFGSELPGDDKRLKKAIEKFTIQEVKRVRTREEWKDDVVLRCTTLKCTSSEMARYAFLSLLRSLPYGNSMFYHVARLDDPIGLLPPKLVLGINNKGVHFFRPIPKEYLHSVELRDIMQFGSSSKAVFFKMRVAGVLHVFQFETQRGEDICMTIQTHINDIMVKRYATLPVPTLSRHDRSMKNEMEEKMEGQLMELQRNLDQANQKLEDLTRLEGKHLQDRERQKSHLHDVMRQMKHLQEEKTLISDQISALQCEILELRSELDEIQKAAVGRVPVGQLVRYFGDSSAAELEQAKDQERQLQLKVNQLHKEKGQLKKACVQMDQCKGQELQELNDAFYEVRSDGKSQINLQRARLKSLMKELDETKAQLKDGQAQLVKLEEARAELAELKTLQKEVQKRNERNAQIIEEQNQRLRRAEHHYKREQISRKKVYNKIEDMKGKIRVYARVRPVLAKEEKQNQSFALHFPDDVTLSHPWKRADNVREYTFDNVFHPEATQMEIFNSAKDLIQSAVDGYNVCLFAYGQTGSGKTYTIHGTSEHPGLAPRGIKQLFTLLNDNSDKCRFNVSCYMLEIYQDTLMDLLLFKNQKQELSDGTSSQRSRSERQLKIKKDRNQVVVQGATVLEVDSAEELIATFEEGQRHRHVASTQLNINSSRSHLIMSIVIDSTDLQTQTRTKGKLSFVDLAGSERNKKSGSIGEQLKEAQAINTSLLALGDVISRLARKETYIPYRNCKLTMLMSDSLGGNAKTLMFVNVSPTDGNLDETQNSLQYAMRVRTIKNEATKETDQEAISLKKRIASWRCMTEERQADVQKLLNPFH